jgi:hypothetical protein
VRRGAVSVWSIGSPLTRDYQDSNGASSSALEKKVDSNGNGEVDDSDGTDSGDRDGARQAQTARNETGKVLTGFDSGNTVDGKKSSQERVNSSASSAAAKLNSRAPGEAGLLAAVNDATPAQGTEATVAAGVVIEAGDDVRITARQDAIVDTTVFGAGAGAVGGGAAISIMSTAFNTTAALGGTVSAGGEVVVSSRLDQDVDLLTMAGGFGFVGLGAAVAVFNDASNQQALIGDGARILSAASISVAAVSNRNLDIDTDQITAGAGAIGASFTRLDTDGSTIAHVGNNVEVGQGTGTVGSLAVTADSNVTAHAQTLALAAGGIAVSVNFAFVDVTPLVRAQIGTGGAIDVTGAVTVRAVATDDAEARVLTGSFGAGAVGASVARANLSPDVEAIVGAGTAVVAGGLIRVQSRHNHTGTAASAGKGALAIADAPSVGLARRRQRDGPHGAR